jgi:hypothetical protein
VVVVFEGGNRDMDPELIEQLEQSVGALLGLD